MAISRGWVTAQDLLPIDSLGDRIGDIVAGGPLTSAGIFEHRGGVSGGLQQTGEDLRLIAAHQRGPLEGGPDGFLRLTPVRQSADLR
jgi:hypothetical protein